MRASRCWTILVVAGGPLLLSGCGDAVTGSPAPVPMAVPDAAPGEQLTLLTVDDIDRSAENFRVSAAYPLPDGTVAVQWDPNATSGGDDRAPFSDPQLSILGATGRLRPLELPERVTAAATSLLGADAAGQMYLWTGDGAGAHLVVGSPALGWHSRSVGIDTSFIGTPKAAVARDGTVYLSADDGVYRVSPDDALTRVVGVHESTGSEDPPAPVLPADSRPSAASDATLEGVWGLAVGPDGTAYISNRYEIVAVDPAGTLSLVTTMTGLQTDLGILNTLDPPYLWSRLAIDVDGSLLVSDSYQQLVADLDGPAIVARHAVLAGDGLDVSTGAHGDLLLTVLDPEALQAGPSRPDRLAALGR